jgi:ribonuclease H / adenosylcobalamin/alpha-ribazole phosphatase
MNRGSDQRAAADDVSRAKAAGGWRLAQGTPTTTLLVRHGQTEMSVAGRFSGRGDNPLTSVGVQQAAAVAKRLAGRGVDLVVTSPLSRARDTAQAVADAAGAPLVIADDFAETDFGAWEGLTFAAVMARWPGELAAWQGDSDTAPPGGESFAAVATRVDRALDRLLADHQGSTIVVVSHVTPIKTLVCRALVAPLAAMFRMHLEVASLCEAAWFADGPAVIRSLNDTAHLRGCSSTARTPTPE